MSVFSVAVYAVWQK